LLTVKGGKFKLSAQGRDFAPVCGNGTKVKIISEIKLPLVQDSDVAYIFGDEAKV
jgi:hypothetical protein